MGNSYPTSGFNAGNIDGIWQAMEQFRSRFEKQTGTRAGRGEVRTAVLALLAEQSMHGYQIIHEIEERSGGSWKPSAGSVYPTLQLLADEGLISAEESNGRKIYSLTDEGLIVTPRAVNVGTSATPFGLGAHPYLSVGEDRVDEVRLGIPARSQLEVDDRLLPASLAPVDGTNQDFRHSRLVGQTALDTAFTNVAADADGRWRVTLAHAGTGRAVTLWADAAAYPWLQVFTGDSLPLAARRTSGIAVEPMTCPPDAFNSGDDLLVLEPGQEFAATWGITPG